MIFHYPKMLLSCTLASLSLATMESLNFIGFSAALDAFVKYEAYFYSKGGLSLKKLVRKGFY